MEIVEINFSDDELEIFRERKRRLADWVFDYIRLISGDDKELSSNDKNRILDEKENVLVSRKYWWKNREYEKFVFFPVLAGSVLSLGRLSKQWFDAAAQFIISKKKRDRRGCARALYEMADTYYYDMDSYFFDNLEIDRLDEAIKEYKEALKYEPNNVEIRYALIGINTPQGVGKGKEALKECLEMLKVNPIEATCYLYQDCSVYFNKLDIIYYLNLVPVNERNSERENAVRTLREVLSVYPENLVARRELVKLWKDQEGL